MNRSDVPAPRPGTGHWASRLPFFYGWLIVAIAFVTMAIGVTARTAFSLLLPPLLDETGWDRGLAAGAFSFGFLVSAVVSPVVGRVIDRRGPRVVILTGLLLMTMGLILARWIERPWHLYATLGILVGGGANLMTYTAHSQFLPNWFVRRRGFAVGLAFSGAGVGAIVLLPWLQAIIVGDGWRAACVTMALLAVFVAGPLNVLVHGKPGDVGLSPDGQSPRTSSASRRAPAAADPAWAAIEWTLGRALRTDRFWWVALGFFCAMIAWYAVLVHQTRYLTELGFSPYVAALALGAVSAAGIPGQISLGIWSDRVGREWVWTAGCAGFAICYGALIALEQAPSDALLILMVISQGFLGYALPAIMGAIVAELFEGPHYGAIFGTLSIALIGGGAAGPWMAGLVHDATGSYRAAFLIAIGCCAVSAAAIWMAAPGRVRPVGG